MDTVIQPGQRSGITAAPTSKSHAHRLLICAALGKTPVTAACGDVSKDIAATASCMNTLCADVRDTGSGVLSVVPCEKGSGAVKELHCGESGSTLRFLIPVCGALGADVCFLMEGRLSSRPLAPLDALLRAHGMTITQQNEKLFCSGKLSAGDYEIPGNISSQFISGLLFALPLLDGDSTVTVTGKIESAAYIRMTEAAIRQAGIRFAHENNVYRIPGGQTYALPEQCIVEGDCSNAAFFLSMGALSEAGITVTNIPRETCQGDREIIEVLRRFGAAVTEDGDAVTVRHAPLKGITIDASGIPDLVPVMSVVAAAAEGDTHIVNAGRLRIKESDRLMTTAALLTNLGGSVEELPEGLIIHGGQPLTGGTVDAFNDHRIAMSAAVAAGICSGPVTVLGSQCTAKSFPRFWENLEKLAVLPPEA